MDTEKTVNILILPFTISNNMLIISKPDGDYDVFPVCESQDDLLDKLEKAKDNDVILTYVYPHYNKMDVLFNLFITDAYGNISTVASFVDYTLFIDNFYDGKYDIHQFPSLKDIPTEYVYNNLFSRDFRYQLRTEYHSKMVDKLLLKPINMKELESDRPIETCMDLFTYLLYYKFTFLGDVSRVVHRHPFQSAYNVIRNCMTGFDMKANSEIITTMDANTPSYDSWIEYFEHIKLSDKDGMTKSGIYDITVYTTHKFCIKLTEDGGIDIKRLGDDLKNGYRPPKV